MSQKTNIAWCDSTGNPWIGCTKVSPGCKHCYAAELDANRFSKTMGGGTKEKPESHWGKGAPRVRTKAFWTDAVKWDRQIHRTCRACGHQWSAGDGYCPRCKKNECDLVRPRIFPSLCDWLDDEVPIEWLADFLKLIHDTPNLDWLLLTKRPENWRLRICAVWRHLITTDKTIGWAWLSAWENDTAPKNVWIGVSVEDQKRADERRDAFKSIPAKRHFVSYEPALEVVDWSGWGFLDWMICGLESGKDRRDGGIDCVTTSAAFCKANNIQYFCKQGCAFKPGQQGRIPADIWALKGFPTV